MIKDIQKQILKLKEENDVCILAHSYMAQEIKEIADFTGDSYALAVKSAKVPQKTVIMCGVRFMAETVKILAPEKKVILSNPDAGCPMAEQMDKETISLVKEQYPDYAVVAYINTTASLKTICDVCVTSSSAVEICKKLDADKILFIPDCNLGSYVAKQVPEKEFKLLHGGCPTHAKISESKLLEAMEKHPNAKVLVHPEHLFLNVSLMLYNMLIMLVQLPVLLILLSRVRTRNLLLVQKFLLLKSYSMLVLISSSTQCQKT